MNTLKLYEIRQDIESKFDEIANTEDPITRYALHTELEALLTSFEQKAGNCIIYHKNVTATINAVKAEIQNLKSRLKTLENRKESIGNYLKAEMILAGVQKVDYQHHTARFQKSAVSIQIVAEDQVPAEFHRTETRVEKQKIKDHFKETGEIVPGTDIVQNTHLRIK